MGVEPICKGAANRPSTYRADVANRAAHQAVGPREAQRHAFTRKFYAMSKPQLIVKKAPSDTYMFESEPQFGYARQGCDMLVKVVTSWNERAAYSFCRWTLRTSVLLALLSPASVYAAPPQILAPYALLVEAETGSILFEKPADDLVAPASLAKLMTLNVVFDQLQLGNIKLGDEYVISVNAWRKGGAPSHGSTMYAALNSRVKDRRPAQGCDDPIRQ